jgi:hypothetical protein
MKYLKALGLAAVAAMALTALIGVGSASATVLCKTALSEGCAGVWDYPAGTEIDLSLEGSTSTRGTNGELLDTCTEGTIKGATTNTGGPSETVTSKSSELWSRNCTTTTVSLAPGSLEIHWKEGTNGTLTVKGTEVTKMIGSVSCVYGPAAGGVDLGTLTGGSPATVDVEAVLPKLSGGFLCPADVVWNGAYLVTTPQPLYVSAS